jgi:rhodanese-related sulfurtransferase
MTLKCVLLAGLLVLWGSALGGCGEPKINDRDIVTVDLATVRQMLSEKERDPKRVVLLDARPATDFAEGHLPTAQWLRPADLNSPAGLDPQISQHTSIVVYGDNPGSTVAKTVTKELLKRRLKRVRMFDGGVEAWVRAGYPLERVD